MTEIAERTNTNFLYELYIYLKNVKFETEYSFLAYYQYLTLKFFTEVLSSTQRGLLLYYTMGMGKTMAAVAISMALKKYSPIIISSISQHANFKKEIKKYIQLRGKNDKSFTFGTIPDTDLDRWIDAKYKFVTLKASNMLKQLSTAVINDVDDQYDVKLGEVLNIENLDDHLLIFDEAHNFFRAIINGSKNAIRLYELIMKSTRLRLLFLTGTPIAKDPFEIVPAFNMLGGYVSADDSVERLIFPEKYTDFYKYFVDEKTGVLKNKGKFQNRIQGLVSYMTHVKVENANANTKVDEKQKGSSVSTTSTTTSTVLEFPKENPLIIRLVHMELKQYTAYLLAREKEKKEAIKASKHEKLHVENLSIPGKGKSSTYRIRSRQISNYYQEGVTFDTPVDSIPTDKLESTKWDAMLKDINSHEGIGMVFSQLLNMAGLSVFARYLETKGWQLFDANTSTNVDTNANASTDVNIKNNEKPIKKPIHRFAFISGDMKVEEREAVKKILNSRENMNGELIKLILISEAGAEGLDLHNIRFVLFIEPQWTQSMFDQVKHRAIRGNSHIMLPPEKRNVTVIVYIAIKPNELSANDFKDDTTDVVIWLNSKRSENLIHSIEQAFQEVSIECYYNEQMLVDNKVSNTTLAATSASATSKHSTTTKHQPIKCRMCNPTNSTIFDWNIIRDMSNETDPCKPFKKVEKKMKSVIVNNITYYWEPDTTSPFGFIIYKFDKILNSYKKMQESDDDFLPIIQALENQN